jgi:hypothetical protein
LFSKSESTTPPAVSGSVTKSRQLSKLNPAFFYPQHGGMFFS